MAFGADRCGRKALLSSLGVQVFEYLRGFLFCERLAKPLP